MEVLVRITKNYGNEAIYPANETAEIFTKLTGKKTLSRWELDQIKALGYKVQAEMPAL